MSDTPIGYARDVRTQESITPLGALSLMIKIIELFIKAWYLATASYPRVMPKTDSQWYEMKEALVSAFGLKDEPKTWYTIASHLQGHERTSMRMSYRKLANVANRLIINDLCQDQKKIASKVINDKLEGEMAKLIADQQKVVNEEPKMSKGASDLQSDMQDVQGTPV